MSNEAFEKRAAEVAAATPTGERGVMYTAPDGSRITVAGQKPASPTLAALRELLAQATAGPWSHEECRGEDGYRIGVAGSGPGRRGVFEFASVSDAALIVALVNNAHILLAAAEEAEALRAELAAVREACDDTLCPEDSTMAAHITRLYEGGESFAVRAFVAEGERDAALSRATTAERELAALRATVEAAVVESRGAGFTCRLCGGHSGFGPREAVAHERGCALLTTPPAAAPVESLSAEEREAKPIECCTEEGTASGADIHTDYWAGWESLEAAIAASIEAGEDPLAREYREAESISIAVDPVDLLAGALEQHDIEDARDHAADIVTPAFKAACEEIERQASGHFWGPGHPLPRERVEAAVAAVRARLSPTAECSGRDAEGEVSK